MSENMIGSDEAIKLYVEAGLSSNTFFRHAREGKIRKNLPELRERGALYNEGDIRKLIGKRLNAQERALREERERTEVAWQELSDLPAILKLDIQVYKGEQVGEMRLYASWAKKNTHITLLAFERGKRDTVVAYINLVPMAEEVIISILKGERTVSSISPDEVESYERKGEYTLLAESVVIHPQYPEQLNKLLSSVLHYWCEQYPDRYIHKIYANAASYDGDILVRKLFFSPLYALSDRAYVLDLRKPGISRVVKRFQECLVEKSRSDDPSQDDRKTHA